MKGVRDIAAPRSLMRCRNALKLRLHVETRPFYGGYSHGRPADGRETNEV